MYKIYTGRKIINDKQNLEEITKLLDNKNFKYEILDITEELLKAGLKETPVVIIKGIAYNYSDAIKILRGGEENMCDECKVEGDGNNKEPNDTGIKLYSTHCPKCIVLEKKLDAANVEYELIEDQDVMIEKGFMAAPMLEVDGKAMGFKEANDWINNL